MALIPMVISKTKDGERACDIYSRLLSHDINSTPPAPYCGVGGSSCYSFRNRSRYA